MTRIFGFLMLSVFKLAYNIGVYILKLLTFSKMPFSEAREAWKDHSRPYFIGFAVLILVGYLIQMLLA